MRKLKDRVLAAACIMMDKPTIYGVTFRDGIITTTSRAQKTIYFSRSCEAEWCTINAELHIIGGFCKFLGVHFNGKVKDEVKPEPLDW